MLTIFGPPKVRFAEIRSLDECVACGEYGSVFRSQSTL